MEKIKSRWRKKYLEGDVITGGDDSRDHDNINNDLKNPSHNHHHDINSINGINSLININSNDLNNINSNDCSNHNHNNHHHHHHHRHHHRSKHSSPPIYEPLEANVYLDKRKNESRIRKDARSMVCDCILTKEERARGIMGCLDGCLNRMLMIECGPKCSLGDLCLNKRFQKFQSAKVEIFKTRKKGWGLRAITDLPPNAFIMEYVGEVIRLKEFRSRVKKYTKQKIKHHYFMALGSDEIIDATVKGNLTRFINHSCEPNCETQKWTVLGDLRIGFFTIKDVQAGEEITFDYQFQRYGRKAQRCYCDTPSCRGWIGGNEQTFSLNGNLSPQSDENKSHKKSYKHELLEKFEALNPGFKIPRLNRLQRLEIEKKIEEEEMKNEEAAANHERSALERKNPFATANNPRINPTTNGLTNHITPNSTSLSIKRRFDSLTTNNIDLTPAPKISKEERRQQFEMHVRLKEYYAAIEKHYGSATLEQVKLSHRSYSQFNNLSLPLAHLLGPNMSYLSSNNQLASNLPPVLVPLAQQITAPASNSAQNPHLLYPTVVAENDNRIQQPIDVGSSSSLIVLANHSIEPGLAISDELAFSLCDYDEYYSGRDKPPSLQDVTDDLYPFPGSYYTTPDGETWFATVTLDSKTQKPRSVIFNLEV